MQLSPDLTEAADEFTDKWETRKKCFWLIYFLSYFCVMLIYFLTFFFANSCKTDVDFFTYRIYLLSYSTKISSRKKSPGYKFIGPPKTCLGFLVTNLKQQFNITHLPF